MNIMKNVILSVFTAVVVFSSCKKEDTPAPATIATTDILVSGSASGNHDLFSFSTGAKVATIDSATTKWDFGLRFEKFIFNSGANGSGNAGVIIVNNTFESVLTAPETGYSYDTTSNKLAIAGAQWYTYNSATRSFAPTAGKTFVLRTALNTYAKMEVISADPADDNGAAVVPPTRPTKIKYKIRFAYQPNGRVF